VKAWSLIPNKLLVSRPFDNLEPHAASRTRYDSSCVIFQRHRRLVGHFETVFGQQWHKTHFGLKQPESHPCTSNGIALRHIIVIRKKYILDNILEFLAVCFRSCSYRLWYWGFTVVSKGNIDTFFMAEIRTLKTCITCR
jgi:hypothetical protein